MDALNPKSAEQLQGLIHELSEALTAANVNLLAYQHQSGFKVDESIADAIEQTYRASGIAKRLRKLVGHASRSATMADLNKERTTVYEMSTAKNRLSL